MFSQVLVLSDIFIFIRVVHFLLWPRHFFRRVMILHFIKNWPKFQKSENPFSQCMIISFSFQLKFFGKRTILSSDYGNGFLRFTHFPKSENNEQN